MRHKNVIDGHIELFEYVNLWLSEKYPGRFTYSYNEYNKYYAILDIREDPLNHLVMDIDSEAVYLFAGNARYAYAKISPNDPNLFASIERCIALYWTGKKTTCEHTTFKRVSWARREICTNCGALEYGSDLNL